MTKNESKGFVILRKQRNVPYQSFPNVINVLKAGFIFKGAERNGSMLILKKKLTYEKLHVETLGWSMPCPPW